MAGNSASLTFKLFGVDVNASHAIRGVGDAAKGTDERLKTLGVTVGKWSGIAAAASVSALGLSGALGVGLAGAVAVGAAAIAAQVPRVRNAFTELGKGVKDQLVGLSGPVQDALIGVVNHALQVFNQLQPAFKAIFKAVAPVVDILGKGLVDSLATLTRALPGLLATVQPLVDAFGAQLVPITQDLVQTLKNILGPTGQNAAAFGKLLGALSDLLPVAGTILGVLVRIGAVLVNMLGPALPIVVGGILAVIGAVKVWTAVQTILNAELFANPIGLVVLAIAALVAGLILAYKHSETFRTIVNGAFNAVKGVVLGVISNIISTFRFWFDVAMTVVAGILHGFGLLPGPMGAPFRAAEKAVRSAKQVVDDQITRIQAKIDSLRGKNIPIHLEGVGATLQDLRRIQAEMAATGSSVTARLIHGGAYQHGTDYVPETGLALLHKGEIVVPPGPAERIRQARSGMGWGGGIDYDRLADALVRALRRQPPVVQVADIHQGLLARKRHSGGIDLGLT